jgi:mannose-6-phosphate isomerase-like protein (cupin superfamily)
MPADHLSATFLRLRPDSSIERLPVEGFWPKLMQGELGDFHHEYLVTSSEHDGDWQGWEMHPNGDEIVCLLAGSATLILEAPDGSRCELQLTEPGSFAFVPRGSWHTAKIAATARFFLITAGEGTMHRPSQT